MYRQLDLASTHPVIRLALRLILLTPVRKSELVEATWDEVDFEAAVWTIPKARMKGRRAHNVYLSSQALDIMIALHTCAAGSRYVLPSRYSADRCISKATLNRVTKLISDRAKASGLPLKPFTVHDLRRTGSTLATALFWEASGKIEQFLPEVFWSTWPTDLPSVYFTARQLIVVGGEAIWRIRPRRDLTSTPRTAGNLTCMYISLRFLWCARAELPPRINERVEHNYL